MERVEPRGTFLSTEFTTFSPKGRIRTPIRWPESGHVANLEVDLSRRPPGPEPDATFSRNPLKTWRFQVLRNQSLSLKLVESYPWLRSDYAKLEIGNRPAWWPMLVPISRWGSCFR